MKIAGCVGCTEGYQGATGAEPIAAPHSGDVTHRVRQWQSVEPQAQLVKSGATPFSSS